MAGGRARRRKLKVPLDRSSDWVSKCRYSSFTDQVRANAHSTPAPATQPARRREAVTTVPPCSALMSMKGATGKVRGRKLGSGKLVICPAEAAGGVEEPRAGDVAEASAGRTIKVHLVVPLRHRGRVARRTGQHRGADVRPGNIRLDAEQIGPGKHPVVTGLQATDHVGGAQRARLAGVHAGVRARITLPGPTSSRWSG